MNLGDFLNYKGSVTVTKKNEDGKALKGAEFEIQDKKGNVQTVFNSAGKETDKLVSDKDGKIVATGLIPGSYQLIETKAPNNYLLNKKVVDFTVSAKASGKPETITLADFINYQGSVKLQKVSQADKALADAVFTLYHADGKQVGEYTSDKAGQIVVGELSPGEYYFTETKAPTGYTINKEKRKFTIDSSKENKPAIVDAGKVVNQEIPKTPTSSNHSSDSKTASETQTGSYPKTNDTRNSWLIVVGIAAIVIAGTIYFRRKNK
ncbi:MULTISPECIES: LPXTG cell wall anchor domain-containing protein [Enterococcus]|uniref:LPXTG cell wall anchor domain-containing protein n=1 Tax=Enterococcus TaxID=1350 RepID=UPI0022DF0A10|nr:LPXTG cell wall anchor domain-containing protein [Enterococcus malodoratus]